MKYEISELSLKDQTHFRKIETRNRLEEIFLHNLKEVWQRESKNCGKCKLILLHLFKGSKRILNKNMRPNAKLCKYSTDMNFIVKEFVL